LLNVFNDLIPGLGDVVSGLMGAYEGVIKFAAASKAGTATLGGFLGMTGAVVGGFMALCDAYDAYNQGQQRDFIIGMNEGIDVTEEMAEKIRLLAQEMANDANNLPDWQKKLGIHPDPSWDEFSAATSKALNEIIDQTDLTADNFDEYAIRVRGILSDLDRGMLTEAETAKEMGDAFTSLMTQAKSLGLEGSASLIAMFEDLENRGIKVAEVQDYINSKLEAGADAYANLQDAIEASTEVQKIFGNISVPVFNEIIAYRKKLSDNKDLIDSIKYATEMMVDLTDTQKISQEQFNQFQVSASKSFNALKEGGMSSSQAIKAMGPYLQRLQFLHEQYGYVIDANTQKILDQAIKEGKVIENKKTETREMIDLLGDILKVLTNGIPGALMKTGQAATDVFKKATTEADKFRDVLDDLGKQRDVGLSVSGGDGVGKPQVFAASGWHGWVAGGSNKRFVAGDGTESERVDITPLSQYTRRSGSDAAPSGNQSSFASNGGQGGDVYNTFHLYNVINPENVLDIMVDGINGNKRQIRSKLKSLRPK
jgi:hypothetical protein